MIRKGLLFLGFLLGTLCMGNGQVIIKTTDLFPVNVNKPGSGTLNIIQPPELDTLMSRFILGQKNINEPNGVRILIYRNSEIIARKESERIYGEFMTLFPGIPASLEFQGPNYYLVLAGNFRNRTEGIKSLLLVSKKYPNAILVPYIINYDELNK
jgi:hypothetical protein